MENGHSGNSNQEITVKEEPSEDDSYQKKYYALLRRCEGIQQNNEKLANRLNYVKRLKRRLQLERRFLKQRLDRFRDNYRTIPWIFPIHEEDDVGEIGQMQLAMESDSNKPQLPLTGSAIKTEPLSVTSSTKKRNRSDKDKERLSITKNSNPYFLYGQNQRSSTLEKYLQHQVMPP